MLDVVVPDLFHEYVVARVGIVDYLKFLVIIQEKAATLAAFEGVRKGRNCVRRYISTWKRVTWLIIAWIYLSRKYSCTKEKYNKYNREIIFELLYTEQILQVF